MVPSKIFLHSTVNDDRALAIALPSLALASSKRALFRDHMLQVVPEYTVCRIMCSSLVTPPTATPLHTVRGVRYAVLGARRVVRGTRKLPFSATVALLDHRN